MQQSAETIAVVNNLLYGLRHELGNLTAVLNFDFEALSDTAQPTVEPDQLLEIKLSLNDLKHLLSRLRTYPQPSTTLDLLDLNHAVLSAVEANRSCDEVSINCRLPAQSIWMEGNQTDLSRALFEVLANAREATFIRNPDLPVEVTVQSQNDLAIVTIADHGRGFNLEELKHGSPFLPGYTTKMRDGFMRGLGMGLFMANAVVELHHGAIQLQNRPEGGAVITITLPLPT